MTGDLEPELDSIMKNIDMATADLAQVSARLDAWTSDNDAEMNAFMQDGLGQVPALVGDTRRVLREIEKLVKDLRENPSKLIHEPQEAAVKAEQ